MKLLNKINLNKIVISHFNTLKNYNTKKFELDDLITFILLPILIATILLISKVELRDSSLNIVITILSVLVGLLFNVIVIVFDIIKRNNSNKIKNRILNELMTNISYSILISLSAIILTLCLNIPFKFVHLVLNWLVFFLIAHFFITILMILKRMYALFINEINEVEEKK